MSKIKNWLYEEEEKQELNEYQLQFILDDIDYEYYEYLKEKDLN